MDSIVFSGVFFVFFVYHRFADCWSCFTTIILN